MSLIEQIQEISTRDSATLFIPTDTSNKLYKMSVIDCKCSCGNLFTKQVSRILQSGVYCRDCTRKRTLEKAQQTCLQRYGTLYPSQSPEVVAKRKPLDNLKEIKEKRIQTNLERYGVPYAIQCKDILDKRQQTVLEKYNTTITLNQPEVNQKRKETWLIKYGTDNPNKNPDIVEKRRITLGKKKIERLKTELQDLMTKYNTQ